MYSRITKRQNTAWTTDVNDDHWYGYSDTGSAIRWSIAGIIVLFFFIWFVGGWLHARRRIRQGKRPLIYHRFLVSRNDRFSYRANHMNNGYPHSYPYGPQVYGPPNGSYQLQAFPPPAYNPNDSMPPPAYQPPPGGSKNLPDQSGLNNSLQPPSHTTADLSASGPSAQTSSQNPGVSESQAEGHLPPRPPKRHQGLAARLNPFQRK